MAKGLESGGGLCAGKVSVCHVEGVYKRINLDQRKSLIYRMKFNDVPGGVYEGLSTAIWHCAYFMGCDQALDLSLIIIIHADSIRRQSVSPKAMGFSPSLRLPK